MTEHIVVAVDGGLASRTALRWVAHHVGAHDDLVELVTVIDHHDRSQTHRLDVEQNVERARALLAARLPAAIVRGEIREGDPGTEIRRAGGGATMIVIGTNRSAESWSRATTVPMRVAATGDTTVVVVPAGWIERAGAVVVGTTHDRPDDAVMRFATGTALRAGGELVIAHAWALPDVGYVPMEGPPGDRIGSIPDGQTRALDAMTSTVRNAVRADVPVSSVLLSGKAAHELRETAQHAHLLVVGRRRRPAIARVLLGSISRDLLLAPPCPIAVVPDYTTSRSVLSSRCGGSER